MGGDLDETGRFRQIDGCVADFGEEDRRYLGVVLEAIEDSHSLDLGGPAVNERLAEFDRVHLV